MKKKLLTILLGCALILGMATGCSEQEEKNPIEKDVQEKSKGKCEAEECIKLIEPNMSVEEVNETIGFGGQRKEDEDIYIWQLTEKSKIEIEYKDGLGTITATIDKNKINNDKLKFSLCYNIINSIKTTTYTYEEMVEKLEGIEGYLATKAPTFKRYIWVKDNQTFSATFSDNIDGKCSIASIR